LVCVDGLFKLHKVEEQVACEWCIGGVLRLRKVEEQVDCK